MMDQYHIKCICGKVFSIGMDIEHVAGTCAKHICPKCGVEILTWIEKKNTERKRKRKPDWTYIFKSNIGSVKSTGCFACDENNWEEFK